MKIYRAAHKLLVGDTQRDWWFDKPTFIFGKYAKNGNEDRDIISQDTGGILPKEELKNHMTCAPERAFVRLLFSDIF
jgi:hypothetical protein